MRFLLSVLFSSLVTALPSSLSPVDLNARGPGTRFSTQCSSIRLNGAWLVANCPKDNGRSLESSIWLGSSLVNREGNLIWEVNGGFQGSCFDCNLLPNSGTLNCTCQTSFRPTRVTAIDLEEHVFNYNGHLLSDLAGPPTIPADKSYPFPANTLFTLQPSTETVCGPGFSITSNRPWPCFNLEIVRDGWLEWQTARFLEEVDNGRGNPGYEVTAYESKDCVGTPIGHMSVQNATQCHTFAGKAKGLAIIPLWNWA
ncbi:Cyanovirin-N [Patellaria atrata CBS 101060]|uniref:Cyanovirin-N n=1 Tax=Patellaria atrata CBS 101060 TaxID=1346257 RepID=A0A9P4S5Q0_9PEZI|nr:Cyanovirin-N [Patellaria atrata CBS 101060]